MARLSQSLTRFAEIVAALMMAAMFGTFVLQVVVRYTARLDWVAETLPWLEPGHFGWTLEFCLALWVWLIFWGNSFILRRHDHVTFDILYLRLPPAVRRWVVIVLGLVIAGGLLASIAPTWERFAILRLKKTATLAQLFGDWIRMRDVYLVYVLFLIAVPTGYLWQVWRAFRHGVDDAPPDDKESP